MPVAPQSPLPILVLRHEPFEHLGHFASILTELGIRFDYCDLGQPCSLDGYSGVIVMGGPMSANDPLPGLAAELKVIDDALRTESPVLGVCLGSQLLAKALGARVYRNAQKEIGWAAVTFTEAGQKDPLFRAMGPATMLFHWHGETFDLPAGTEWLAYSERCRHQAFRHGRNAYGLQFHPEVTPEMIADWCTQPANCGDVAELEEPVDQHAVNLKPLARQALEGWLTVSGLLPA